MISKQILSHNIVWSPNSSDRIIKWFSKQIELCQIKSHEVEDNLANDTIPARIYTHSENDSIKCVSWQMSRNFELNTNSPDIVAIALMSGIIKILSLGESSLDSDEYNLADRELRPKNIKMSVFLEWNPWERNLLAQGIDKSKGSWVNEPSIFIWEIQKDGSNRVSGTSSQHSYYQQVSNISLNTNPSTHIKVNMDNVIDQPLLEYCRGDVVNSFAWINRRRFVCGINNKILKVFEIPEIQPSKVILTDAVNGLCVNVLLPTVIASFVEEKVIVWKDDQFDYPVLTYMEGNVIEVIEWSPLRDGYLCVTFKEKHFIKVLDTRIALNNSSHELDNSIVNRLIKSSDESNIISASWHRKLENCILLYLGDDRFEMIHIRNRKLASWSVQQKLIFSTDANLNICYYKNGTSSLSEMCSNNTDQFSNENKNNFNDAMDSIDVCQEYLKQNSFNFLEHDIGFVMKERAIAGYGLKFQSKELLYSAMFKDRLELKVFWRWLEDATANTYNTEHSTVRPKTNTFSGIIDCIRDVVTFSSNKRTHECVFHLNADVSVQEPVRWNNMYDVLPFPRYNHEFRDKIFSVCGLPFNKKIETWRFLLEKIENKERAAAIALVTLNFDLALQYLKRITNDKGMDNEMLRLCLAGFNTQSGQCSNSNWSSICRDVLKRLGNSRPYLRLIFNFLIVSNKQDLQFIKSSSILLLDKLAIATLYMDDEHLVEFLNYISNTHLKCGNLEAVVMTGLRSKEFIDLLQAYVDRTYDVQTAAIAVLQANILTKNALGKTKVSSQWVESYRHFLDNWSLWFNRADFDIANQYVNFSTSVESSVKLQKQPSLTLQITKAGNSVLKPSPNQSEVHVACSYCYWKISPSSKSTNPASTPGTVGRTRPDGSGLGNTAISSFAMHSGGCKATICQNCRKPLPRCSVCLMNMGTVSDSSRNQNLNVALFSNKEDLVVSSPIGSWFIWCQKCKHGGHAGHLHSWFLEWEECPVSGCKCPCSGLDSSFSLSSEFSQKCDPNNSE